MKEFIDARKKDYLDLRSDLINQQLEKQKAKANWEKEVALAKANFEKEKYNLKQNKLCPKFCDLTGGQLVPPLRLTPGKTEMSNGA